MSGVTLFVGPLCRFFAGADGDPASLADGVAAWREDLRAALQGRPVRGFEWDELADVAPATFDPGARGLDAVRLLAVHAQRPELDLPDELPERLELDRAFADAEREDFGRSHYGQLLAARIWLPGDFDFTFRCPRPDGEESAFGSLTALRDQVGFLIARTFQPDDATLAAWRELRGASFLDAVRRGTAELVIAVDVAVKRRLPLLEIQPAASTGA